MGQISINASSNTTTRTFTSLDLSRSRESLHGLTLFGHTRSHERYTCRHHDRSKEGVAFIDILFWGMF